MGHPFGMSTLVVILGVFISAQAGTVYRASRVDYNIPGGAGPPPQMNEQQKIVSSTELSSPNVFRVGRQDFGTYQPFGSGLSRSPFASQQSSSRPTGPRQLFVPNLSQVTNRSPYQWSTSTTANPTTKNSFPEYTTRQTEFEDDGQIPFEDDGNVLPAITTGRHFSDHLYDPLPPLTKNSSLHFYSFNEEVEISESHPELMEPRKTVVRRRSILESDKPLPSASQFFGKWPSAHSPTANVAFVHIMRPEELKNAIGYLPPEDMYDVVIFSDGAESKPVPGGQESSSTNDNYSAPDLSTLEGQEKPVEISIPEFLMYHDVMIKSPSSIEKNSSGWGNKEKDGADVGLNSGETDFIARLDAIMAVSGDQGESNGKNNNYSAPDLSTIEVPEKLPESVIQQFLQHHDSNESGNKEKDGEDTVLNLEGGEIMAQMDTVEANSEEFNRNHRILPFEESQYQQSMPHSTNDNENNESDTPPFQFPISLDHYKPTILTDEVKNASSSSEEELAAQEELNKELQLLLSELMKKQSDEPKSEASVEDDSDSESSSSPSTGNPLISWLNQEATRSTTQQQDIESSFDDGFVVDEDVDNNHENGMKTPLEKAPIDFAAPEEKVIDEPIISTVDVTDLPIKAADNDSSSLESVNYEVMLGDKPMKEYEEINDD